MTLSLEEACSCYRARTRLFVKELSVRLPRRSVFLTTVSVAVVIASVACSPSSKSEEESDDSAAPTEAVQVWEDTDEVYQQVLVDLEQIYQQCMEAEGFDIHAEDLLINQSDQQAPWDEVLTSSTITAPPLEEAQDIGYGAAPNDVEESGSSEFRSLPDDERAAYWVALRGYDPNDPDLDSAQLPDHEVATMPDGTELQYPTTGCQADGDSIVFDDQKASYLEAKFVVRDRLFGVVFEDVTEHETYTDAVGEWSSCMSERGYDVSTPLQARNTASDIWYHTEDLSDTEFTARKADEIELATHHAECADETQLRQTHESVMWEAVDGYLVEHDEQLQAWDTIIAEAADRAREHLNDN